MACDIPKFPGHFTGTGDVLSSMLLTQMEIQPNFTLAIQFSINVLRGVLQNSVEKPLIGTNEISLVASKKIIENPEIVLEVYNV